MLENRLTCLNTKFQKRRGKLWTDTYANNAKAQIEYILMNKKWNNDALDCEAYSSFEDMSYDHQIFTAKIRLSLRRNADWTTTAVHYDRSLFNNKDISNKYTLTPRHKFDALQEVLETLSSSSCRATTPDIPDPLSPLLPIIHRFWQVFRTTSRILT